MTSLTVFGSARVDVFLELSDDQVEKTCDLDTQDCFIKLSYASKIPLKSSTYLVGGNGANVAVGTRRLGMESTLVAELGEGMMADFAYNDLGREIDLSYVTRTAGVKEGFGAVIVYQGERTILSYYPPETPVFPHDLPNTQWAYLTSVGESFLTFFEQVLPWLDTSGAKLVFNPGGRQIKMGKSWLGQYLQRTHLLMVNREEGEKIVGFDNSFGQEKELLNQLMNLGPKIVVITDGENGSYAKEAEKYYRAGIVPVDAIERTGCGDSYSTGCMNALMQGLDLPTAMRWGTVNAASVIGYVGPQPGLLNEEQMQKWLATKGKDLVVEEM